MMTPLSLQDRQALALKAVEGLSDQTLEKLARDGGVKKVRDDVERLHQRVLKMGESVESLVAFSLLAQAYMEERKESYQRQQQRQPAPLRRPITKKDLYPKGFSMEEAQAQAKEYARKAESSAPSSAHARRRGP